MRKELIVGGIAALIGMGGVAMAGPGPIGPPPVSPPIKPPTFTLPSGIKLTPGTPEANKVGKLSSIPALTPAAKSARYLAAAKLHVTGFMFMSLQLQSPVTLSARKTFIDASTYLSASDASVSPINPGAAWLGVPDTTGIMFFPKWTNRSPVLQINFLAAADRLYVLDCTASDLGSPYVSYDSVPGNVMNPLGGATVSISDDGHLVYAIPKQTTSRNLVFTVYPASQMYVASCDVVPAMTP